MPRHYAWRRCPPAYGHPAACGRIRGRRAERPPSPAYCAPRTMAERHAESIGCSAMAVRNTEQLFHLVNIEVGDAPGANLSRRPQFFEFGNHAGEIPAGDWRMQQIEIEIVCA